MPVRQQYFIAAAIIGLIGVMAVFAMFDYLSDRDRFAEQMVLQPRAMVAPAGTSYSGAMNTAGLGCSLCYNCGWQGFGARNGMCPNCRAFLRNANMGVPPLNGQNAAFTWFNQQPPQAAVPRGILFCPVCDFAMSSQHNAVPNSIRCPRCPAYLVLSDAAANDTAGRVGIGQQARWAPNCPLP